MRFQTVFLLSLLLFIANNVTAAEPSDGLLISYTAPKAGDKATRSLQNEMSVKLTISGGAGSKGGARSFDRAYSLNENTKLTQTVMDAGKNAATKVKVEYQKDEHTSSDDNGTERKPQIVSGKTYVVANTRSGIQVYTPDEKLPADSDEAEIVRDDFLELGHVPHLSLLFADHKFKIGEKIAVPDKDAQGLFSDAGTLKNLSFTLREVKKGSNEQDSAIFDLEVTFERHEGYLTYTTPLKGELVIGVQTAWPERLAVSGNIAISGTKPAESTAPEKTAKGTGTMKYSLKMDYARANDEK